MTRIAIASVLALALAACAGAEADPKTSTSPASTAAPADIVAGCEAFFTRARECTADYIPALVDLRIELDKPAGIRDAAQTEGRDAIIAQANEEWAQDSLPAAIHAMCEGIAQQIPPDQLDAMRAEGNRCLETSDCASYSTCAMELQRPRIAGQPQ